jgi:3-oxoacyl-[acyl-carrier protein] reductase
VNCLAPGGVENEKMRAALSADRRAAMGAAVPLKRIGRPADIAAATLFLASSQASWITGVTLDVAGGRTML